MNSTVLTPEKLSKLKSLAKEVDDLTYFYSTFKKDADFYKLQSKQNELLTLIIQL
jgi:hypothetical protein